MMTFHASTTSLASAGRKSTSPGTARDRKSTRLNSSHLVISYAVFCLKKKKHHVSSPRPTPTPDRRPPEPSSHDHCPSPPHTDPPLQPLLCHFCHPLRRALPAPQPLRL